MKRVGGVILATVMAMVIVNVANANVATPRVERREARQQARIHEGVRSGDLTRGEAYSLERGQARVERAERRAKADGYVTPCERRHLARIQNHQSRRIRRLKHNAWEI